MPVRSFEAVQNYCPEPAAQKFVAAVRAQDPAMVREQEEVLDLEKGK